MRLVTTTGQSIFSQSEDVYYVRSGDVLAFPNPVGAGVHLSVIAGDQGEINISLYDALGCSQRTATATGTVNTVGTDGLLSGFNLVRVQTKNG